MNEPGQHLRGRYPKYPEVIWDLAEERYQSRRFAMFWAYCEECGWDIGPNPWRVLPTPERRLVVETVAHAAHAYSCSAETLFAYCWPGPMVDLRWSRDGIPTYKVRKKLAPVPVGITVLSTFGPGHAEVSQ